VPQNKKTQEKVKEDLSLVSIPKLKKIKNEMNLLLGDKVPGQCEEALEDYECDVMYTQQCCIYLQCHAWSLAIFILKEGRTWYWIC
jgi:hypothetical protein